MWATENRFLCRAANLGAIRLALLTLLAALLLSGCASLIDPESSQDTRGEVIATVQAGQSFGQTFVSRRARLDEIALWLAIDPQSADQNGEVSLALYHAPGEAPPLFVTSLSFAQIRTSSPVKISLPPQPGPPGQNYYLTLSTLSGTVQVLGRAESGFPPGQAFSSGAPLEATAAFRLSYDYGIAALLDDLKNALSNSWVLIPLGITLLLPGWLLLDFSGLGGHFDWGERFAISMGLSMASIPLLMTWTTILGLHWSQASVWVAAGVLLLLAVWRGLRRSSSSQSELQLLRPFDSDTPKPRADWTSLALVGVFVLTLSVRLIMTRDLSASPWVDSVHHALITRLILDHGAFPSSYTPYLNIDTARYHAGFHSLVATFHWLSGLDIRQSLLLFGQVLNALSVFAVYLLATTLLRSRTAGVFAALITGLFTPMPAYLTSWGRYTQLAGLLILPAAAAWIKILLESRFSRDEIPISHPQLKIGLLAGATSAGLFLTHYRVAAFLALLILAIYLFKATSYLQAGVLRREVWRDLGLLGGAAGIAILLTLPWWPSTLTTLFIPKLEEWTGLEIAAFSDFSWSFLTTALGHYTLTLAYGGLALGLLRRRWFPLVLGIWAGLLFLIANLGALRLPGGGFVNNISVEITLFMPISVAGGYLLSQVDTGVRFLLPRRWRLPYSWGLAVAGLLVALVGARHMLPILNPGTFLFRQADAPAMTWIEAHIPSDETILINPFAWGYGLYAGNDGGFWITPITGRKTMPPPVLYGLDSHTDRVLKINEINQKVIEISRDMPQLQAYLQSLGIQYVYIGARGGVLSPRAMQDSQLFDLLYQKGGVWIFRARQGTSAPG